MALTLPVTTHAARTSGATKTVHHGAHACYRRALGVISSVGRRRRSLYVPGDRGRHLDAVRPLLQPHARLHGAPLVRPAHLGVHVTAFVLGAHAEYADLSPLRRPRGGGRGGARGGARSSPSRYLLALMTIALRSVCWFVSMKWHSLTGGEDGMLNLHRPSSGSRCSP